MIAARRTGWVACVALAWLAGCESIDSLRQSLFGGDPEQAAAAELAAAVDLYERGEWQRALARFEALAEQDPSSADAFYHVGLCYLRAAGESADPDQPLSAEEEKSLAAFERALAINPRHALASVGVGDLYARRLPRRRPRNADPSRDPYQLALAAYEKAVAIDPHLPVAQRRYAELLERIGQHQKAEQAYQQAAAAAADIPEVAPDYYVAYGRFLSGRAGRLEDAIVQYELARMFRQNDPAIQHEIASLHTRIGQGLFENHQYSLAEQSLVKAYEMFPDKTSREAQSALATLNELRSMRRR